VTGDGRVTIADVLAEARAIMRGSTNSLYDINHDGRVNNADLQIIARQLGRSCTR
jgi:hypothetical protein